MTASILATKLYIPPPQSKLVHRSHLIEWLNAGLTAEHKLSLISAPAGFGKTTLVSEWIAGCGRPVAWLSLDKGDNDLSRFLAYLVAALQTLALPRRRTRQNGAEEMAENIGAEVLALINSPQPPPTESILTTLVNDIATLSDDFVLVLDDYHEVDAKPIDHALTFLIEHLPPQMHLVIATREDPYLPLAQLRARNQLTELRVAELRFTFSEATEFFNQLMGLNLSAENIAALETRTEGWVAGLQLAAISMRGYQDTPGFIQSFTGSHRFVMDYLVEQVLQQQPERTRIFLLHTCILDRMCGPLCDAILLDASVSGQVTLEFLERANLFVIPLDHERRWYRYHHLFADVLRMRLMAEQSDQVSILHRRASEWYEQNGSTVDAIRHALAAEDFERAANLIERSVPEMRRSRQEATLLAWLKVLPDEIVHSRPVLSVAYAWALLASGELERVESRLRDAEQWLSTTANRDERSTETRSEFLDDAHEKRRRAMVVVDQEEFRHLPGVIALYRAALAQALGNITDTMNYARQAFDLFLEDEPLGRGAASAFLGLACWASGNLETAYQTYTQGMAWVQRAGNISDAISGAIARADIRIAQGHLHEAMRIYEQALQLAMEQGTPTVRGTADMYVGISDLHRERNNLNDATQYLHRSKELGDLAGLPQNPYRWRLAMARVREAQGEFDDALDLLQEAGRLYVGDFSPNARPIEAFKTRVWIAQGKLSQALAWVRERNLSVEDDLTYLREFEHITLARVLLARSKNDRADRAILPAIGLLERLLNAAETGGRMGSAIEILVLLALARQMQDNIPDALAPLEQALTLAEPEGYVRIFVDEGAPMAILLEKAAKHGITPNYVGQLLTAFGKAENKTPVKQDLVEPLSERELDVLRLFKTELSGPEIARELVIALSTVRTHTKSIYSKLNVNNRRAAVKRATELNLI
jgi:LuxR family maltose regulon positive regulatory protein